jgi:hypothetical protein
MGINILQMIKRAATETANPVAKVLLDPGVAFPLFANIPAFVESGSREAVVAAGAAAGIAVAASIAHQYPKLAFAKAARWAGQRLPKIVRNQFVNPLRVNGWTLLAPTLAVAVTTGSILPIIAGSVFSSGSFAATNEQCQAIQNNPEKTGVIKIMTCPAIHWGVGYSALGIMAGGLNVETVLGIATTASSSVGLVLNRFSNPASPFMILVHATAMNAMNAAVHGNWWGVANMAGAGLGEFLVGRMFNRREASRTVMPTTFSEFRQADILGKMEVMNWPLRLMDRSGRRNPFVAPQVA